MKLYKLTDEGGYTYGGTQWEVGKTNHVQPCAEPRLCTGDVLHAYTNLNLGLLLNPQHADFQKPRVFECKGEVVVEEWDKVGSFSMLVTDELDMPDWYRDSDIRSKVQTMFAILCAESVLHIYEEAYPDDDCVRNAVNAAKEYLNNPSADAAARAAAYAAGAAARAAADAAARAAAYAAGAAAGAAAWAAARAAAYAARAAAWAAADAAAGAAAWAAAYAAYAAADVAENIDFEYLADQAVAYITE